MIAILPSENERFAVVRSVCVLRRGRWFRAPDGFGAIEKAPSLYLRTKQMVFWIVQTARSAAPTPVSHHAWLFDSVSV